MGARDAFPIPLRSFIYGLPYRPNAACQRSRHAPNLRGVAKARPLIKKFAVAIGPATGTFFPENYVPAV